MSFEKGTAMLLMFYLARRNRIRPYVWSPALDLRDRRLRSTLISGTQF